MEFITKDCLACGSPIGQVPGKRSRLYCNPKCKANYFKEVKAKANVDSDMVSISRVEYNRLKGIELDWLDRVGVNTKQKGLYKGFKALPLATEGILELAKQVSTEIDALSEEEFEKRVLNAPSCKIQPIGLSKTQLASSVILDKGRKRSLQSFQSFSLSINESLSISNSLGSVSLVPLYKNLQPIYIANTLAISLFVN